jgi:uncharacterized protein with GYD domain
MALINFTDEGIRNIRDSTHRAAQFRTLVERVGGSVHSLFWAVGEADGCVIFECPDEMTATAVLLSLGQQGHVRTRTLRVYDQKEFEQILSHVP